MSGTMIYLVEGTRPQNLKGKILRDALTQFGRPWTALSTKQHADPLLAQANPDVGLLWGSVLGAKDWVIVEGDTRSTLQGAMWAKMHGAFLIHVEAGCRSYEDIPEEHIRVVVDHLADERWCPTLDAQVNLSKESLPLRNTVVGDLTGELLRTMK